MSGVRFDYAIERQRHARFVGRAGLLGRLDELLVDSETDRWVVITGGPGMGKSALLAAWLARSSGFWTCLLSALSMTAQATHTDRLQEPLARRRDRT